MNYRCRPHIEVPLGRETVSIFMLSEFLMKNLTGLLVQTLAQEWVLVAVLVFIGDVSVTTSEEWFWCEQTCPSHCQQLLLLLWQLIFPQMFLSKIINWIAPNTVQSITCFFKPSTNRRNYSQDLKCLKSHWGSVLQIFFWNVL